MEGTDVWEVWFKGVSDAGEVNGHRFWVDVVTYTDNKE